MLKKLINRARIDLKIIPLDPLLIKSGQATVSGVNMSFVRTYHCGDQEEPFIPGSSMKGMIRAYAERICRSLRDKPVPVCLPYVEPDPRKMKRGEERQASCGLWFVKYKKEKNINTVPSTDIYRVSCPICRLFGSHTYIGRLATSDGYLTEEFRSTGRPVFEIRDGVAIDRLTGGAAGGAKYDLEVLTRGEFGTSLEIRNFELWQLALIALVLRDMEEGLIRLGFSKSRGLGKIRGEVTGFQVDYFNQRPQHACGLWEYCSVEERKNYGLVAEGKDGRTSLPEPVRNGLRYQYDLTDDWRDVFEPAVGDLVQYIENVQWPDALEKYVNGRS